MLTTGPRAWTLLTQKRPMLNAGERLLPDWTTCAYKEDQRHAAIIDKTIDVTLRKFNRTV